MAGLESYMGTKEQSLDSFQIEGELTPFQNDRSSKHLAAYSAALSSPDQVETAYFQSKESVEKGTMKERTNALKQASMEGNRDAMIDYVTNPDISDDLKRQAINSVIDGEGSLYNLRNQVSEDSLIADSGDETPESEGARINMAGVVDEVNTNKRAMQNLLNGELSKSDPSLFKKATDLAEMMVPFADVITSGSTVAQGTDGGLGARAKTFALLGEGKQDLSEVLRKMPPNKRMDVASTLVDIVNSNSGIVLSDENDLYRVDMLRTALEDGYYESSDRFIDDVSSVLDIVGLGSFVRGLSKASRAAKGAKQGMEGDFIGKAQDVSPTPNPSGAPQLNNYIQGDFREVAGDARISEEVSKRYIESDVAEASLAKNYKDTNPARARTANEAATQSEEASQAMYGTTRAEAVSSDTFSGVARSDGSVENKVSMKEYNAKAPKRDARIMDYADSNGAIYLSDAEKASAATRVVNDFNNATGLTARKEMSTPKSSDIDGTIDVGVMYGPKDMGWSSPEEAMELVKLSLRDYGVKDSDLTLMRKDGSKYVPAKEGDELGSDYLVQVDYKHRVNPSDIEEWEDADVMYNFFDRIPHFTGGAHGSFTRHLIDAHSMLDPRISQGATVAIDKAAGIEKSLLKPAEGFGKRYAKLSTERKQLVEQVIKEANYKGRMPKSHELKTQGFNSEEIEALKNWKESWDNVYWMENSDLVRTLKSGGYGVVEDSKGGTRLFGKAQKKGSIKEGQRVYDVEADKMVGLSKADVEEIYQAGGEVAKLRQPVKVGDEAAEFTIARNQLGRPTLRGLREDDQVLNYREGYYSVRYKDPHFIIKKVKDSRGNVLYEKAVATAKNMKEAELSASRLAKANGEEFYVRGDVKDGNRFSSDENWDVQVSGGRSAQKIRGERLEDSSSPINDPAHNNILGPVDSLLSSVRSVSSRVSMREYLEASKARAVSQYGEMFPKDKFGRPKFPSNSGSIKAAGKDSSKKAADARSTVEYITYLENGYLNAIDDGYKWVMRGIADSVGAKGWGKAEEAARAASEMRGPTAVGRSTAFTLYLALNPIRQIIVQGHQSVQLLAIAPRYAATRLAGDTSAMVAMLGKRKWEKNAAAKLSGRSVEELEEMALQLDRSGMMAAIDKQNLVRESMTEISERSKMSRKVTNPIGLASRGVETSRKVGFDAGEAVNTITSWLTFYNRAKEAKKGGRLSQKDFDKIAADARNYTYNMNRAGDMPYNENALNMIFQFMQVPHKALMQWTTNRVLTKADKSRVAALNAVLYGAPTGSFMYSMVEPYLPQDGELRELVMQGLESYAFNKLLTLTTGENVSVDISSLAAADISSMTEMITNLATTDVGAIVAGSPAGSLMFGNNPRIADAMREVSEYFHFIEPETGVTPDIGAVFQSVASLSSGYSNAYKARMAMKYNKIYNSSGGVVSEGVPTATAIAKAFGFGSLEESRRYYVSSEVYEQSKSFKDDVKKQYTHIKKELMKDGVGNDTYEFAKSVNNWALSAFDDSPAARRIIRQQMNYDLKSGDAELYENIRRNLPVLDSDNAENIINNLPEGQGQKDQLRNILNAMKQYKDED